MTGERHDRRTTPFQVVYGTGAYSGAQGLVRDSDEAYRWLSKATTSLAALPSTLANGETAPSLSKSA